MTLIVGLKSRDCVVIGAEQEEAGVYTAKRSISKLRLIAGSDWTVIVGGAGDSAVAESGMRDLERKLHGRKAISEQALLDATDKVLNSIHTKYIDVDPDANVEFVIGAVCGDQLHLISTQKRTPQVQDSAACAGYGSDIAIYFIDRLHDAESDWTRSVKVAGLALQQAIEAAKFCSGEPEIYVLQRPPNPRWRSLGTEDAPTEFLNAFQRFHISGHLEKLLESFRIVPERFVGYSDEHHPLPVQFDQLIPVIPLEFFPLDWVGSPAYRSNIDEICSRNRDRLLQLGLLNNQAPPTPTSEGAGTRACETPAPPQEAKE